MSRSTARTCGACSSRPSDQSSSGASILPMPKTAPCGSATTVARPKLMSIGGMITVPPSSATFAAAASVSVAVEPHHPAGRLLRPGVVRAAQHPPAEGEDDRLLAARLGIDRPVEHRLVERVDLAQIGGGHLVPHERARLVDDLGADAPGSAARSRSASRSCRRAIAMRPASITSIGGMITVPLWISARATVASASATVTYTRPLRRTRRRLWSDPRDAACRRAWRFGSRPSPAGAGGDVPAEQRAVERRSGVGVRRADVDPRGSARGVLGACGHGRHRTHGNASTRDEGRYGRHHGDALRHRVGIAGRRDRRRDGAGPRRRAPQLAGVRRPRRAAGLGVRRRRTSSRAPGSGC